MLGRPTAAPEASGTKIKSVMWGAIYSLPYHGDGWWYISRLTGSLIHSTHPPPFSGNPSPKIVEALAICDEPYRCGWSPEPMHNRHSPEDQVRLNKANEILFLLGNKRFLLSLIYAGVKNPIFETTAEAFSAIGELPNHNENTLDKCLQRTLLAVKTSRSFYGSGVMFIGADLSSHEMHAWIIERGEQPDHDDRSWINYRPLLAIAYA